MGKIFKVNGKFKILPFVGLTILPLIGGGGIGYLIRNSINIYGKLDKPIFSPPSFVFIIVWIILYLLMGFASYRIYMIRDSGKDIGTSLFFYIIQLLLNYLWPVTFFYLDYMEWLL